MTKNVNEYSCEQSSVHFGSWVYRPYRRYRKGLLTIPGLERNMTLELVGLFQMTTTLGECKVEYRYLRNSLETIRKEIQKTAEGLVKLIKAVERSGISDDKYEQRIGKCLSNSPNKEAIIRSIQYRGGVRSFLKHPFAFLRTQHNRYSDCIKLVDSYASKPETSIAKIAIGVADCITPKPEEPDVQHFVLCLLRPLICVTVVVVLIVLEDTIDPDPPEDEPSSEPGDFPIPPSDEMPA